MLHLADWLVIIFYLLFVMALGPVFKSFNKNASDFFRGGGNMTWWIATASIFMTGFSAWTYTGAAGKIYKTGFFFLTLTLANFIGAVFTVAFTAHKFRQMRVITGNEAVRHRFGRVNEQVMTWLPMPFNILFGGISLYTIAQFMSCVLVDELALFREGFFGSICSGMGLDGGMVFLIVILTLAIVVMTMLGGSWAATAGDFVQMLMLVAVSVAVLVLVLYKGAVLFPDGTVREGIGGFSGLAKRIAEHPELYNPANASRWWILVPYLVTLILNQTILQNSLTAGAAKFVFVKTGHDARKISAIAWLAAIPHTLIFLVPALACAVLISRPELAHLYPRLANPEEASYIQIASMVLPAGLIGLLICAIFAATLTSMNSGLNATSGSIIRNIYLPLINPNASETRQIWLGRLFTLILGVLYFLVALFFSTLKSLPLYELVLMAATCTGIPQAVPLVLGMFNKKAPDWAAWSTLAFGFAWSVGLVFLLDKANLATWFAAYHLSDNELNDLKLALTTGILIAVCVGWFYFCVFLAKKRNAEDEKRVETFFTQMNTPIDPAIEGGNETYNSDARQFDVIGKLSLVYGVSILVLLIFDNPLAGRLCILGCGGFISALGLWLIYCGRRKRKLDAASPSK